MTAAPAKIEHARPEAADLRLLCLLPSIPLGGMERAALRVVEELMARGAAAHVLAERRWGVAVQREVEAIGAPWTGVSLPFSLGRPSTLLEARTAIVSAFVTTREFTHAHSSFRSNALLATTVNTAFFARRLARHPGVVSAFRIPNPPVLTGRGGGVGRIVWRRVGAAFDHLVCNSDYTAARVAEVSGAPEKVRVVRNFEPSLRGRVDAPALELPPRRRHVVFIGQVSEAKGVAVLVEAATALAARYDDVDFVLAGPTVWRSAFPEELRARLISRGLAQRVKLLGPVANVHGLLQQAYLHVCPSVSAGDSFPNVILDAKQAAVPSIVFPTAGLPEAIEDGVDGIVTQRADASALSEAIALLLDAPRRRDAMAFAAAASLTRHASFRLTTEWLKLLTPTT